MQNYSRSEFVVLGCISTNVNQLLRNLVHVNCAIIDNCVPVFSAVGLWCSGQNKLVCFLCKIFQKFATWTKPGPKSNIFVGKGYFFATCKPTGYSFASSQWSVLIHCSFNDEGSAIFVIFKILWCISYCKLPLLSFLCPTVRWLSTQLFARIHSPILVCGM